VDFVCCVLQDHSIDSLGPSEVWQSTSDRTTRAALLTEVGGYDGAGAWPWVSCVNTGGQRL